MRKTFDSTKYINIGEYGEVLSLRDQTDKIKRMS